LDVGVGVDVDDLESVCGVKDEVYAADLKGVIAVAEVLLGAVVKEPQLLLYLRFEAFFDPGLILFGLLFLHVGLAHNEIVYFESSHG